MERRFACDKLPCESCSNSIHPSFPNSLFPLPGELINDNRSLQRAALEDSRNASLPQLHCSVTSVKLFHILTLTASMVKQNITPALQPHKLLPKAVRIKFLLYAFCSEAESRRAKLIDIRNFTFELLCKKLSPLLS